MINTRELARLAGVSQSTVSRCLNNHPNVKQNVRERVLQLAREHGYSLGKSSIHLFRSKTIAILAEDTFHQDDDYTDIYRNRLVEALLRIVEQNSYFPMISFDWSRKKGMEKIEELVSADFIVGFIIINSKYNPEIDKYLTGLGIPYVCLHFFNQQSIEEVNLVDTNHFLGGYLATRHLIELGHRKILTLAAPGRVNEDRTNGFKTAMQEAGLPVGRESIAMIETSYDGGYQYVKKNLSRLRSITGIFVQNDLPAIGCINGLHSERVSVPGDISVVGYDGIEAGRFCQPELTTVIQPMEELVQGAVDRLLSLVENRDQKPVKTYIQPTLTVRGSTGTVRE